MFGASREAEDSTAATALPAPWTVLTTTLTAETEGLQLSSLGARSTRITFQTSRMGKAQPRKSGNRKQLRSGTKCNTIIVGEEEPDLELEESPRKQPSSSSALAAAKKRTLTPGRAALGWLPGTQVLRSHQLAGVDEAASTATRAHLYLPRTCPELLRWELCLHQTLALPEERELPPPCALLKSAVMLLGPFRSMGALGFTYLVNIWHLRCSKQFTNTSSYLEAL